LKIKGKLRLEKIFFKCSAILKTWSFDSITQGPAIIGNEFLLKKSIMIYF